MLKHLNTDHHPVREVIKIWAKDTPFFQEILINWKLLHTNWFLMYTLNGTGHTGTKKRAPTPVKGTLIKGIM